MSRFAAAVLAALLLLPSASLADEFSDFRIPAHRVASWTGDFGLNGYRAIDGARRTQLRGDLASQGLWIWDSDPRRTMVEASGSARASRGRDLSSFVFDVGSYRNSFTSRSAAENWSFRLQHRLYPWAAPTGFDLDLFALGEYVQSWSHSSAEQLLDVPGMKTLVVERRSDVAWLYRYATSLGFTAGLGRVRDATGIFDVRALEQRLLETGGLTRPLSAETRRKLAALLYLRESYRSILERPARTVWQEVERILREDGALSSSGLHAYSILRSGERSFSRGSTFDVLPSSPVLRQVGMFGGFVLSGRHVDFVLRRDRSLFQQSAFNDTLGTLLELQEAQRTVFSEDELLAGATLEYHRPLGLRLQADARSRLLFPLREREDGFEVFSEASLAAIATDRWLATAFVSQQRAVRHKDPGHRTLDDGWRVDYGASAIYYLENRVQIRMSAFETQATGFPNFLFPPAAGSFSRFGAVTLSLSYRFLGNLTAPGIAAPVRTPLPIEREP